MAVSVVIPWTGGCPHRERALEWVAAAYASEHPDWTLKIAEAPPGPWVKALAVMPAVADCAEGEIVVVADADVHCQGLSTAVAAVEARAPWAVPHLDVVRLSEQGTAAYMAGADWRSQSVSQKPYPGVLGGGLVVACREVILSTPLDARFVGWG